MDETHQRYMQKAIDIMRKTGVVDKTGGPFGAVIVVDGTIVAACGNSVIKDCDPTAHAEMNAIRQACKELKTFDLSGAILYTSCECCPMCYAAAYWARISKIYYAASWKDYEDIFDDARIDADMKLSYEKRALSPEQIGSSEAIAVWREFKALSNGARY